MALGKWKLLGILLGIAVVIVALVFFWPAPSHKPSPSPTTSPQAIEQRYDGKDPKGKNGPESKCADPPPSQPIVQAKPSLEGPEGRVVGNVELRASAICPVIWARVNWNGGSYRFPQGWVLHITMHRSVTSTSIDYPAYQGSDYIYSNMLTTVRGCVYAEVFFAKGPQRTSSTKTPCVRNT